jgi:very-short-patch-repair endonuclease
MTRSVTIARNLRRGQTDAERKLWFRLRDRRVVGLKFRRQMPLGRYIVDFCCESARLVIEVDGGQHSEVRDLARTRELEAMGYLVLRFWNNDVLTNTDGVIESVLDTLHRLTLVPPHPSPLPTGEREQT